MNLEKRYRPAGDFITGMKRRPSIGRDDYRGIPP
jgi:hypothetical protein